MNAGGQRSSRGLRTGVVQQCWWIGVPVALTAIFALPITRNYFFGDDLLTLYKIANEPLPQVLLAPYGGHVLIVRNAITAALYAAAGPEPYPYYVLAVLTHLVNVALLAILIRGLTGNAALACVGSAWWGTAPIIEGTIGWFAVYGHALATTILLAILLLLLRAERKGRLSRAALLLAGIGLWAGSTSFGIGLALVALMPLIAWLLLSAGAVRRRAVAGFLVALVLVPLLYAGAQRLAFWLYGRAPQMPAVAMLLRRVAAIADLTGAMFAYGLEHLVLGPLASGRATPRWWLVGLLLAGIAGATWSAAPRARRAMLAFALLALGTYGIIAAGRVQFYGFKRLIVSADRYHYVAPLALTVLLCMALAQLAPRMARRPWLGRALFVGALVGLTASLAWRPPINNFPWPRRQAAEALAAMHEIIRRAPPGADVYLANQPFRGVGPLVIRNPRGFPGWAALFAIYHPANELEGRRVFFVEPDWQVRAAGESGRRSATLLVAPEDVPAGSEPAVPPARVPAPR